MRRESVSIAAVCALFVALSITGLVAAFLTRLIANVDGLLLAIICLMMGGLFGLALFSVAQELGWLPKRRSQAGAKAANSSSAKTGEGK